MPRTLISIEPEDKNWLDHQAKEKRVPMTEIVRRAIRAYRIQQENRADQDIQSLLNRTAGLWKAGDGLVWQEKIRGEWNREH